MKICIVSSADEAELMLEMLDVRCMLAGGWCGCEEVGWAGGRVVVGVAAGAVAGDKEEGDLKGEIAVG
jgi:hypothetical protein